MAGFYMKELTVPIPTDDRRIVIRRGKTVEYEIDRCYLPENGDTRVQRRVIGKVDPVNPGRMFPNELYFQMFPENEVPEEVRDEFLRGCEIRRMMKEVRVDPNRVIEGVVNGINELGAFRSPPDPFGPRALRSPQDPFGPRASRPPQDGNACSGIVPQVMMRRLFDDMYYAIEELAGRYPNEVIAPYKVGQINEVLKEIRAGVDDERILPYLRTIEETEETTDKEGKTVRTGLTYSDALMALKWYRALPR